MEYTNSYRQGSCLFEDVCDMSFSKDGKVICLTSSDGNIDGKFLVDKSRNLQYFRLRSSEGDLGKIHSKADQPTWLLNLYKKCKNCSSTEMWR